MSNNSATLVAYQLSDIHQIPIVAASVRRNWIEQMAGKHAYRCLPMSMANQSGWLLLNPYRFLVHWTGKNHPNSVRIIYPDGSPPDGGIVTSNFGYGILTWHVNYLFRTSPNFNLLVRGPANEPKRGIYALEGLVETDWSAMSFTMNWKITEPDYLIPFSVGDPFCMIVPHSRDDLENVTTEMRSINANPELYQQYQDWREKRIAFREAIHKARVQGRKVETHWQKHYFLGASPSGNTYADNHRIKRHLNNFMVENHEIPNDTVDQPHLDMSTNDDSD